MQLFAVIGKPILHNQLPQLWNHAFRCLGISAHCFRINPIDIGRAVKALRGLQLSGCMVAPPFQHDLVKYLDESDNSVEQLQTVNTIKNDHGQLVGWNTDPSGIVDSLGDDNVAPDGKTVVILGADGAAQAAAYGLLRAHAGHVILIDRNYERAIRVAGRLGGRAVHFGGIKREVQQADILISCVSPSARRVIKPAWLHKGLTVFDLHHSSDSLLVQDAREGGCRVITGTYRLVYQAASAFRHFFRHSPVEAMKDAFNSQYGRKKPGDSISFIGFMGAGKTTVGRQLAELTGKEFVDTDKLIEQKAGASIPDIFEQYGEARFRAIERDVFEELDFLPAKVISCGGGAVIDEGIRSRLQSHSTVIWLWNELQTSLARIERGTRPLFNVSNVGEKARALFKERIPTYAQCADMMMVNEQHTGIRHLAKKIYEDISYG